MYIKEIKYEDFGGNEVTEKFYFNLSESELTMMNLTQEGGLQNYIERIVNTRDAGSLAKLFNELILMSYGEVSDDRKHFIKIRDGHKLAEDFMQTEAYSVFFMELANSEKSLAEFINGVVPKKLLKEAEKQGAIQKSGDGITITPVQ